MKTPTTNRFCPLKLRNEVMLANRIIVPPMASETSNLKGYATDKTIAHYANLAKSQAALVMVEYSFVHWTGRSEEFQLGISHDDQVEGLKLIANEIHKTHVLAGIQLTHSGGKTEGQYTDGILQSPSGIVVPVKDKELEVPSIMSISDINDWKEWFRKASDRAVEANFDLVELHAAHGYGLNQWLSPMTNKRNDEYGGSIINNCRLLLEIISDIKTRHPALLISVRMPGQDFLSGGLSCEDSILIAQVLQNAGVDILNISSGIGGWRRPTNRSGEGYLVEEAALIQSHVSVPVIGVGGIESGTYIDQLLKDKKISLAAVGRAILKDPAGWGEKQLGSTHA